MHYVRKVIRSLTSKRQVPTEETVFMVIAENIVGKLSTYLNR